MAGTRELFEVFDPDDGDMPARQYHALRDLYAKLETLDEASRG